MSKRITHIAPWQAGKLFAVIYFFLSLIVAVPLVLINMRAPPSAAGPHFGVWALIVFPVLYALAALIVVPLGCWLYNTAAKFVGGLQITIADDTDP